MKTYLIPDRPFAVVMSIVADSATRDNYVGTDAETGAVEVVLADDCGANAVLASMGYMPEGGA